MNVSYYAVFQITPILSCHKQLFFSFRNREARRLVVILSDTSKFHNIQAIDLTHPCNSYISSVR